MGGFNSSHYEHRIVAGRSAVGGSNVVRETQTDTKDKQLIARILRLGGNADMRAVDIALGHVRAILSELGQCSSETRLTPRAERFCRRIVAQGRLRNLPYALHRIQTARRPADALIASGISHGNRRSTTHIRQRSRQTSFQRAILPDVSRKARHANRQLSVSLSQGVEIPNLPEILADTFAEGGKRGFVEIRDFLNVLKAASDSRYDGLCVEVRSQLTGNARNRFQKLLDNRVVTENDFIDQPGD